MAKQEVGNYPSELVHLYGKETIDECIRVIVEFEKNSRHSTLYEFLEEYVPQAKLTLFQAETWYMPLTTSSPTQDITSLQMMT